MDPFIMGSLLSPSLRGSPSHVGVTPYTAEPLHQFEAMMFWKELLRFHKVGAFYVFRVEAPIGGRVPGTRTPSPRRGNGAGCGARVVSCECGDQIACESLIACLRRRAKSTDSGPRMSVSIVLVRAVQLIISKFRGRSSRILQSPRGGLVHPSPFDMSARFLPPALIRFPWI